MPLPTLAICKKCGRGFVGIGTKWLGQPTSEWRDGYYPDGTKPKDLKTAKECGGRVELTDEGRKVLEAEKAKNT